RLGTMPVAARVIAELLVSAVVAITPPDLASQSRRSATDQILQRLLLAGQELMLWPMGRCVGAENVRPLEHGGSKTLQEFIDGSDDRIANLLGEMSVKGGGIGSGMA